MTKTQAEQLICIVSIGTMGKGANRGKTLDALLKQGMVEINTSGQIIPTEAGRDFALSNHNNYDWHRRLGFISAGGIDASILATNMIKWNKEIGHEDYGESCVQANQTTGAFTVKMRTKQ